MEVKKVPARYSGEHPVILFHLGGPYYNAKGERLVDLSLRTGDTLMMPAHEVCGETWLLDPRAEKEPVHLGLGRVVLPEHQAKDYAELLALGYQFHEGRADFERIEDASTSPLVDDSGAEG